MNADERAEIQRLHAAGQPITRIAATMRMSRNTVRGVVASAPSPAPDEDRTAVPAPTDRGAGVPSFATEFIGRRSEITELRALLGAHRLVTIAGFGGVGKTRLAARVAVDVRRAYADGVRMIELASVRNPELLPQVVLDGLGLSHLDQPARSAVESLVDHLRGRQMLIVLDNCEHLRQACAELVDRVLRGTTQVTFLTTSREVLDVPGEHVEVLEPLPTEDASRHGEPTTAMTLFESRARDVLSGFRIDHRTYDAVRRVVERLDGLPLAIELACFRLRVLSVGELADRLDEGFALLSTRARSGSERHQSLQAAMAWSYELCTPEQRLLWARTSVFAGGFDAAMVEAVCSDNALPPDGVLDCIYDLVGKSVLLREEEGGCVRFRVLESIREFGQATLSEAERTRLQSRHLAWCSRLVSDSVDRWFGPGQLEVAERLRVNLPNLRAALQTALAHEAGPATAAAADLVALPWWLWACGLSAREHTMWLEQVLALDHLDDRCRRQALSTLAMAQTLQGERPAADLNTALALAPPGGDETVVAFATNVRGLSAFFGGDLVLGEALLREAISRYEQIGDVRGDLWCTPRVHLGMLLSLDRRTEEAARCFEAVRDRCESADERWMLSYAVFGLGLVALSEERYAEAVCLARSSLELKQDFQDGVGTSLAIELLGWAEAGAGSATRAALLLAAASVLWGDIGQQLYGSDQWQQRRALFEEQARHELGDRRYAECQAQAASMALEDLMELARGAERTAPGDEPYPPADARLGRLSTREREVALRVAEGLSNKQIAEVLVLSPRTIEGHVEHILQKLGLRNRQEIAVTVASGVLTG